MAPHLKLTPVWTTLLLFKLEKSCLHLIFIIFQKHHFHNCRIQTWERNTVTVPTLNGYKCGAGDTFSFTAWGCVYGSLLIQFGGQLRMDQTHHGNTPWRRARTVSCPPRLQRGRFLFRRHSQRLIPTKAALCASTRLPSAQDSLKLSESAECVSTSQDNRKIQAPKHDARGLFYHSSLYPESPGDTVLQPELTPSKT